MINLPGGVDVTEQGYDYVVPDYMTVVLHLNDAGLLVGVSLDDCTDNGYLFIKTQRGVE